MIIRKFGCAAVCLAASALLATPVLGDTIGGGAVHTNDTGLNLRAQPSAGAEILMRLYRHQELMVLEKSDVPGWVHVKTDVIEGYVMESFLVYEEAPSPET